MELQNLAGQVIRRLNQISTSVFQARLKQEGIDLTPVQYSAMAALRANPGMDQATVAAYISYDRATIGGVIERLEAKGLLRREVNSRDRRARVLTLSQAGVDLVERLEPIILALENDILTGLSVDERETFLSLARKAASAGSNLPTMPRGTTPVRKTG